MRLTEAWRDSINASDVPLDTRALAIIQRAKAGPLALDLYYWLAPTGSAPSGSPS